MGTALNSFDFSEVPTLETERLTLRRISDRDRAAWLEVWKSPGVLDYLIDLESVPSPAAAADIIAWAERIFAEKSGIRWAIAPKPEGDLIGTCGFHLYERRHRRVEIGYELHSDYWRQGIMTEAVQSVLAFCFERLRTHRVEADVVEGNVASAALLKKVGFTLEGVWRERVYTRGGVHSLWQFGLLAPEYQARQSTQNGR